MAEPQAQRAMTLEEFASIRAALEAGLPRDEILAEAGFTPASWQSAEERWLTTLADQAALGRLADGRRYVELVGQKKPAASARARRTRKKLPGKAPVAPAPPIAPRLTTASERLSPTAMKEAFSTPVKEQAPRAPIGRGAWADDEITGVVRIPDLPRPAAPALPFAPALDDDDEPLTPRAPRPDAALPFKPPSISTEPEMVEAEEEVLPFSDTATIRAGDLPKGTSPLPFTAAPAPAANPLPFKAAPAPAANPLPFKAAPAPAPPLPFKAAPAEGKSPLPFSPPAADSALPFARRPRTRTLLPDELGSSAPPGGPPPNPLPFSAPPAAPPAAKPLPFVAARAPAPAAPPLPFNAAPEPTGLELFSVTQPVPRIPAAAANPLPFTAPPPPAKGALPFSAPPPAPRPTAAAVPFAMPFQRPAGQGPSAPPPATRPAPAATQTPYQAPPPDRFTLADYAHLCAGVRVHPTHVPWLRSLYGLSEEGWTALHGRWQQWLTRDPDLRAEWNRLIQERMPAWRR